MNMPPRWRLGRELGPMKNLLGNLLELLDVVLCGRWLNFCCERYLFCVEDRPVNVVYCCKLLVVGNMELV